jgi:isopropylmalate/homocitrate/citramalate synthase
MDVVLAPAVRAELAGRLEAAGLARVEVASFVRDERVPAMAGAEEVVAALPASGGTTWAGLVLNERGYERLAATGLPEAHVTFAVTETFQQRNAGSSVEEGLRRALAVAERARTDGRRVTATLSCAFGCPYEGEVDPGIVLADTIGVAGPSQVGALVTRLVRDVGVATGVHLHDTRGTALACVLAGLESGATLVDGSVGGIGGCPFAPGAQGNVATEDVVYLLEREGIATGVDLDALIETARWLASVLDRPLPGRVQQAGAWP